jgi:hypothetical protein
MKRFANNPLDDAAFWQPAPLLQRLVAEGKTVLILAASAVHQPY